MKKRVFGYVGNCAHMSTFSDRMTKKCCFCFLSYDSKGREGVQAILISFIWKKHCEIVIWSLKITNNKMIAVTLPVGQTVGKLFYSRNWIGKRASSGPLECRLNPSIPETFSHNVHAICQFNVLWESLRYHSHSLSLFFMFGKINMVVEWNTED